jgi:hypothetical protein
MRGGENFKYQKNDLLHFFFKRFRLPESEYHQLDQWFPRAV